MIDIGADWAFGGPDVFNFFQRARQFPPFSGQTPGPPLPPGPIATTIRRGVGHPTKRDEYVPRKKSLGLEAQYLALLEHGDITTEEWTALYLIHGVNP